MSRADVLVVGAGPAGAATAIHLARAGLRPLVLDARAFPRSKPCGDAVSPGASPLLRELGVWETLAASSPSTIHGWRMRSPRGTWFGSGFREDFSCAPAEGLAIDRRVLDDVLLEAARAAGARVLERRRVYALLREAGRVAGVRARGPDGAPETHRARFVVGADGLRSRVARLLGPVRGGRRPRLAIVARLEGVGDGGTLGELRLSAEGVLGMAPIGPDRANVTVVLPRSRAARLAPDTEAFLRDRMAAYGLPARLIRGRLARPPDVTGPFEARPRRRTAPGALLVGDAAGYFDPLTGQGVYGALRGGALAADAAAASVAGDEAAALAAYERALDDLLTGTRRVQRLIDAAVRHRAVIEPLAAVLAARPGLAGLLLEVTGDRLPAGALLRPSWWWRAARPVRGGAGTGGPLPAAADAGAPAVRRDRGRRLRSRHAHP